MECVTHGYAIACHYARSWFLLDLLSSLPLEQISAGSIPGLRPMRLLKFGKLAKIFKLLRLGKLLKILRRSELIGVLEEFMWSKHCHGIIRLLRLMLQLLLIGHWFACIMLAMEG